MEAFPIADTVAEKVSPPKYQPLVTDLALVKHPITIDQRDDIVQKFARRVELARGKIHGVYEKKRMALAQEYEADLKALEQEEKRDFEKLDEGYFQLITMDPKSVVLKNQHHHQQPAIPTSFFAWFRF
jgi:hypothetical protein